MDQNTQFFYIWIMTEEEQLNNCINLIKSEVTDISASKSLKEYFNTLAHDTIKDNEFYHIVIEIINKVDWVLLVQNIKKELAKVRTT